MFLQSKEGINVLQVWSLNDLTKKNQQVWTLGICLLPFSFSFLFLFGVCRFFQLQFIQIIVRMCLYYLFRLLLRCVCKTKKELCQVMLFIVVLQVLSSCELTMDNDEWAVITEIIIFIEVFKQVWDIQDLHQPFLHSTNVTTNINNIAIFHFNYGSAQSTIIKHFVCTWIKFKLLG